MAGENGREQPAKKLRICILGAFFAIWTLFIVARLVWIQVIDYGDFARRALRQQQRTIEVAAQRGIIYDRNGHELAMTVAVDSVFAVPSEVADPATTALLLGKILHSNPSEILERLQSSRAFAWIARKVDNRTSARIRALNLSGIHFQKESKRFYPKNEMAAQVLGYVGMDDEGLGGIERAFDERLRGRPGRILIQMDAKRRWYGRVEKQPDPGENVILTIDEKMQYIAEKELQAAIESTHAEAATVVVQNPKTGEILALANRPTFNPNRHAQNLQQLKNRAVSDVYEPGSTFKMVTISAALEEKLTSPDEVIDCQLGQIYIGGRRIRDWRPYGNLTVAQVLALSSDVGSIKLGMRLGEDRLYKYIRDFGFGQQTGLELPGETRGLAKPVNRWSKTSIGAISMGQEIGVTPLQLVSMTSAIANDGIYTPPRIVAGITPPRTSPATIIFRPAAQHRAVSPITAAEMRRMLEGVVLFGTAKKAILDGYTSAGKTGTAQKINLLTHTYDRVKYIASFSGFAPVNNPVITVSVIIDSPVGAHHGGDVAAPIFNRIAQQILAYLNVRHDVDPKNPQRIQLRASTKPGETAEGSPDRVGEIADFSAMDMVKAAPMLGTDRKTGEAKVVPTTYQPLSQQPPQLTRIPTAAELASKSSSRADTVIVDVDQGPVVPSFLGKPVRSVIEEAQQAGVEVDVLGSGIARAQAPPAGSRLPVGAHVAVRFAR